MSDRLYTVAALILFVDGLAALIEGLPFMAISLVAVAFSLMMSTKG